MPESPPDKDMVIGRGHGLTRSLVALLLLFCAAPTIAEEWIPYFSSEHVLAYYDKGTKHDHTITVRWVYTMKGTPDPANPYLVSTFRAYCSTRQLFTINQKDDSLTEVNVAPDTLYEATWQVICGEP